MDNEARSMLYRFALAQALEKKLSELVKTREPFNLRGKVDEIILSEYEQLGVDRLKLVICGEQVGSVTVKMTKGYADIQDYEKYNKWLDENNFAHIEYVLNPDLIPEDDLEKLKQEHPEWFEDIRVVDCDENSFLDHMVEAPDGSVVYEPTGETLDFVIWIPEQPMGTMVKGCDPDKVLDILNKHGIEAPAIVGLLESE